MVRTLGGGASAVRVRRRQGQGAIRWAHGLVPCVKMRTPGGGASALRGGRGPGQRRAGGNDTSA
eukprot:295546-Heterocapsa_arctica.AAC.1